MSSTPALTNPRWLCVHQVKDPPSSSNLYPKNEGEDSNKRKISAQPRPSISTHDQRCNNIDPKISLLNIRSLINTMLKRSTQQETASGLLINECEDFGATVVVEPCEGNSALKTVSKHVGRKAA